MAKEVRRLSGGTYYTLRLHRGVWYITWSEQGRSKRQSTRQTDLARASAFLDEWLTLDAAAPSALTCGDLLARYYSDGERGRWVVPRLLPTFGDLRPADVTRATERGFIQRRRQAGAADSTIRLDLATLRASWSKAVGEELLAPTDLPRLDPLMAGSPPRSRWLSGDEVERLLAAARAGAGNRLSRVERFIWLALHTCARRRAIEALRWDQVDFEAGVVNYLPDGEKQTRKRRASVPISDKLRPVLREMHAQRQGAWVLDDDTRIDHALYACARRAGVEGVSAHVFRHTGATWMAREGVPLWIIAKILGNTIEQVERVYAKWQPDMLIAGVNAI